MLKSEMPDMEAMWEEIAKWARAEGSEFALRLMQMTEALLTGFPANPSPGFGDVLKAPRGSLKGVLVLGLAFGMTEDGAPGPTNAKLAELILGFLQAVAVRVCAIIQWEIFEAMVALGCRPGKGPQVTFALPPGVTEDHIFEAAVARGPKPGKRPRVVVAPPPGVTEDDIADPLRMADDLYAGRDRGGAMGIIYGQLPPATQRAIHRRIECKEELRSALAAGLNSLVEQQDFAAKFAGLKPPLEFAPLRRRGAWTEYRRMPKLTSPTDALPPYQARRCNRFILESVLGSEVLKPGQYLSTHGAIKFGMDKLQKDGLVFDRAVCFGHPHHLLRVRERTKDVLWGAGIDIPQEHFLYADCLQVKCDPKSAQDWTLPGAFRAYDLIPRYYEVLPVWARPRRP